jgi:hypothetical protein
MERDWNAILDLPVTCTGIGAALRDYYLVRDQQLPDRLAELLKELDGHQPLGALKPADVAVQHH